MEEQMKLVILDSDYEYLKPLEEALIRRLSDRVQIQIITDPAYADVFFHTPRTIDVLVVDEHFYGPYLDEHTIGQILVLVPGIEIMPKLPKNVRQLVKYIPEEEILKAIEKMLKAETKEREGEDPSGRQETRVAAVYSPAGGCGKSLAAVALARKMQRLDVPVLLIGCDSMQSFSVYLSQEVYADETLAEKLKDPEEDTYWNILQNIRREELTCLLPFEKPLYAMGIGLRELENLLSILKEKGDFACIILDLGSEASEKNFRLMEAADVRILVTQANQEAAGKMRKLQKNRNLMAGRETFLLCNQYGMDHSGAAGTAQAEVLPLYPDWESAMEDPLFYRLALQIME